MDNGSESAGGEEEFMVTIWGYVEDLIWDIQEVEATVGIT